MGLITKPTDQEIFLHGEFKTHELFPLKKTKQNKTWFYINRSNAGQKMLKIVLHLFLSTKFYPRPCCRVCCVWVYFVLWLPVYTGNCRKCKRPASVLQSHLNRTFASSLCHSIPICFCFLVIIICFWHTLANSSMHPFTPLIQTYKNNVINIW